MCTPVFVRVVELIDFVQKNRILGVVPQKKPQKKIERKKKKKKNEKREPHNKNTFCVALQHKQTNNKRAYNI
jgi:hypothetical protein